VAETITPEQSITDSQKAVSEDQNSNLDSAANSNKKKNKKNKGKKN